MLVSEGPCYQLPLQSISVRHRQECRQCRYLPPYLARAAAAACLRAGLAKAFSALLWHLAALSQDAVQAVELAEETPVRDDASVVLHRFDGFHQGQVLSDHQVGQHQRGWAAHSHSAVDQHLTYVHTQMTTFIIYNICFVAANMEIMFFLCSVLAVASND